jgi:enamine deaminase RidA (YjgF/YER057c/UK114 family)
MKYLISALALIIISANLSSQSIDKKLDALGIKLPPVSSPVASYVNSVKVGNLLYLSGKGPKKDDGNYIVGKLGDQLTIEQGRDAARLTGLLLLAEIKSALGSLDKVKRVVKVLGLVNASPDFKDHPKVMNGFSDLMIEVFGDIGRHARSSIGVSSLPFDMAVEIEVIVEFK